MIINFLVAIFMVHWGQTFEEMTPALAIIFSSLLFLFQGPGKYSLSGSNFKNSNVWFNKL